MSKAGIYTFPEMHMFALLLAESRWKKRYAIKGAWMKSGLAWALMSQQEAQVYCVCCLALAVQELPVTCKQATLNNTIASALGICRMH